MNKPVLTLLLAVLMTIPLYVFAGSGHDHGHSHKASPSHQDHTEKVSDNTLKIKTEVIDGIQGVVLVESYPDIVKNEDKLFTHNIRVTFVNKKSGKPITDGDVVLRFTHDHKKAGNFINMIGKKDYFATDVFIASKGEQHMMLAASLEGAKTRKFHFHFMVD